MKQKILEALRTKFAGLSDEMLEGMVNKLAKTITDEDAIDTTIEGVSIAEVIDIYKDRKVTEGVKAYEKNRSKQPKKTTTSQDGDDDKNTGEGEDKMDKFFDMMKAMQAEIKALKTDKLTSSRKEKFDALLKDVPENLKKAFIKDFSRLTFKDDEEYEEWLEEKKADITELCKDYNEKGASSTPPTKGGSKTQEKKTSKEDAELASKVAESLLS